jgi:hypothetical protein
VAGRQWGIRSLELAGTGRYKEIQPPQLDRNRQVQGALAIAIDHQQKHHHARSSRVVVSAVNSRS